MTTVERIAIVGSGASCIYVLKHLLDQLPTLRDFVNSVSIFERDPLPGMGMPYHPETTDFHHLCNISSREIPPSHESLCEWLGRQPQVWLSHWGLQAESIDEDALYPRLVLGVYFRKQFEHLCRQLREAGISVEVESNCEVTDIMHAEGQSLVTLVTDKKTRVEVERVFVCTGHSWPQSDVPSAGYYSSPWPIAKVLPKRGELFNFKIGLLGASLSAFDVVTSLAHRHGTFTEKDGQLRFQKARGAEEFTVCLHSKAGRLPQLQFEQTRPLRQVYRHASRDTLLALRRNDGFLRLEDYFDAVCRPTLAKAFRKDCRPDIAELLESGQGYTLDQFVEEMTREHEYDDAFEGMQRELLRAQQMGERPCHWKENLDDLMYALNFHVEMLSAEDHQKLSKVVMPFLLNVMAALPLPSAKILLALREARCIDIVEGAVSRVRHEHGSTSVDVLHNDSTLDQLHYRLFIDCSGQHSLEIENYPFPSLVDSGQVRKAFAKYAEPGAAKSDALDRDISSCEKAEDQSVYYTGGLDIDSNYRIVNAKGHANPRVYELSFPHTAGVRPYSYGLQACNETARLAICSLIENYRPR